MQQVAHAISLAAFGVCTTATILWYDSSVLENYSKHNREDDMLLRYAKFLGSLTIGLLLTAAGAMAADPRKR